MIDPKVPQSIGHKGLIAGLIKGKLMVNKLLISPAISVFLAPIYKNQPLILKFQNFTGHTVDGSEIRLTSW